MGGDTTVAAPPIDPVDALAARAAERCGLAIDPLQIAAMLESDGMTDRTAVEEYGYADVFALAEEVYRRLPRRGPGTAELRPDRARALREISHGVLYVLPTAVYPAVAAVLGVQQTFTGMICATAVGWVWGMGSSWVAYRMLGHGRPDLAARVLRWSLLLGVLVPGAVGAAFLEPSTLALAVTQLAFQLTGGILLFYRGEVALFAVALPAVCVGLGYLLGGQSHPLAIATVTAGIASTALAVGLAFLAVARVEAVREPVVTIRSELAGALPIIGYAALSAVFLLSADARFAQSRLDLALAVTPIVLGMGVLEWRARRFAERTVGLLRRTQYPSEFRRKVLTAFATDLSMAVGVLGALAAVLALVLYSRGQLSWLGAIALGGHVLLGGGYFAGFLLINSARFGWLLGVLGGVVAAYLAAVAQLGPERHVHVFAVCSALIVSGLVVGVLPGLGQVWRYA